MSLPEIAVFRGAKVVIFFIILIIRAKNYFIQSAYFISEIIVEMTLVLIFHKIFKN